MSENRAIEEIKKIKAHVRLEYLNAKTEVDAQKELGWIYGEDRDVDAQLEAERIYEELHEMLRQALKNLGVEND